MDNKGGRNILGAIILQSTAAIDKNNNPIAKIISLVLQASGIYILYQHINPEITEDIIVIRNAFESIIDIRNSEYVLKDIFRQN
jgi:hypothetical protein